MEDRITYPLTAALLGIPEVRTIRSYSMVGLSSVYVIFNERAEYYWGRSRILEKLDSLPEGILPQSAFRGGKAGVPGGHPRRHGGRRQPAQPARGDDLGNHDLGAAAVLTSTGRGAEVMVPMAIPTFGGMILSPIDVFVVPVLSCWREERRRLGGPRLPGPGFRRRSGCGSAIAAPLTSPAGR